MAQHHPIKKELYPETHKTMQWVMEQAFRYGKLSNLLDKPWKEDMVRGKFVRRLTDDYAEITEGASKAFYVSNIRLGAKFVNAFGKEAISTPEKNALEVHTDEKGNVLGIYFVL
jgi:hypothetical protein